MKIYLASSLSNAAAVRQMRDALRHRGHEITYDWTSHGSAMAAGQARIAEVAAAELAGVRAADGVIVLLPGGRGTHVELGAALALAKPVIVVGTHVAFNGADSYHCAFYYLPGVTRVAHGTGDRDESWANACVLAWLEELKR